MESSVDWVFGDRIHYFSFFSYKKSQDWFKFMWGNVHNVCPDRECTY